jgi:hypothetical protein
VNLTASRSPSRHWQASIGSTRALARCGRAAIGQVLAVFRRIAYLATEDGEVLAVSAGEIPLGPLSISLETTVPAFSEWLSMESSVRFRPDRILLDGNVVRLNGLTAWDPHLRPKVLSFAASDWPHGLEVLCEAIRRAAPRGSLAILLEEPRPPMASESEARLLGAASIAAQNALLALRQAILTDNPEPLGLAAAALAGLGGGYTPAGDDFLMGMALAHWVTLPSARARSLNGAIAEAAAPRTTSVSAAYLRAAADGAAPAGWHALIDAMVSCDPNALRRQVRQLCTVGHTSGADSLTGFALALQILPEPLATGD